MAKNNKINQNIQKNSVSTGYGNTRSINTIINSSEPSKSQYLPEFSCCIDWLSCSFEHSNRFDYLNLLIDALDLSNYEYDSAKGLNGYQIRRIYDEDTFLQLKGPKNVRGIETDNLIMSGDACRRFENREGSWSNLFYILHKYYDARYSRADLAIDYYGTDITLDWISNKLDKAELTTRFLSYKIIKEVHVTTGKILGWSITFGKHGSMCQLQIYDKVAERASKDIEVQHPHWLRFEVRFGGGKAHDFVLKMMEQLEEIPVLAPEILNDIIEFKKPSADKNKARWDIDPKWNNFLKSAKKYRIMNAFPPQNTIDSKKKWFDFAMPKLFSLLAISSADWNQDEDYLIVDGIKKMTKNDLLIINKYRNERNLPSITRRDLLNIVENISGEILKEEYVAN